MPSGAQEGGMVVHHDPVVQDRREGRTDQLVTAEPGHDPDDVVALPRPRRSAGVDERRVLAVDRGGGAVRVGGVLVPVEDLDFIEPISSTPLLPRPWPSPVTVAGVAHSTWSWQSPKCSRV